MDISSYGYMNHFSKDEDQGSDGSEKEAETLVDEIVALRIYSYNICFSKISNAL